MPASADERHLVERTLAGDREAFRVIVLRHQRTLFELLARHTGDPQGAEDLVQEAFLRAYRALDRFDPRFSLSTWLARIALNAARDQGRKARVRQDALPRVVHAEAARQEHGGRAADVAPDLAAERREAQVRVGEALAELPHEQREVVVLSVYGGLSHAEIAAALEQPLGTIKSRMRAALGRLRRLVAPLGGAS